MGEQGVQQRTEDTPLEGSCVNSQSWVNREYSRGLRTHPWRAPVLLVSVEEVLLPILIACGLPVRKSRIQLQSIAFQLSQY
jgi:hypothetical protein